MKLPLYSFYSVLICFLLHTGKSNAQNFSQFAGAGSAAIGHSSVAHSDIWSAHHNQAGLAFLQKPELALSAQNRYFLKELVNSHLAACYPLKTGSLGFSMNYYGFELYNHYKFGLNYSRPFGRFLAFGLQLNYEDYYVEEGLSHPAALTIEAGIIIRSGEHFSAGFHIYNPAAASKNKTNGELLPQNLRLGAEYKFSDELILAAEFRKQQLLPETYAVGIEYSISKILALRSGINLQPYLGSIGTGIHFGRFEIDLAFEYSQVPGCNATVSLQYKLRE